MFVTNLQSIGVRKPVGGNVTVDCLASVRSYFARQQILDSTVNNSDGFLTYSSCYKMPQFLGFIDCPYRSTLLLAFAWLPISVSPHPFFVPASSSCSFHHHRSSSCVAASIFNKLVHLHKLRVISQSFSLPSFNRRDLNYPPKISKSSLTLTKTEGPKYFKLKISYSKSPKLYYNNSKILSTNPTQHQSIQNATTNF